MASAAVMAITKWSISGSKKAAACACFTSPIDARCKKESPGGEAGASPKEKIRPEGL
jgi:hypothetical protein